MNQIWIGKNKRIGSPNVHLLNSLILLFVKMRKAGIAQLPSKASLSQIYPKSNHLTSEIFDYLYLASACVLGQWHHECKSSLKILYCTSSIRIHSFFHVNPRILSLTYCFLYKSCRYWYLICKSFIISEKPLAISQSLGLFMIKSRICIKLYRG